MGFLMKLKISFFMKIFELNYLPLIFLQFKLYFMIVIFFFSIFFLTIFS